MRDYLLKTAVEMKIVCERNGSHYFDEETVKFFGSSILYPTNRFGLFVECIDNFDRTCKLYMVKFLSPAGDVETIEPAEQAKTYEHFSTLSEAKEFRSKLTSKLHQMYRDGCDNGVLDTLCDVYELRPRAGLYVFQNESGDKVCVDVNTMTVVDDFV